jgi:hypothetical protein
MRTGSAISSCEPWRGRRHSDVTRRRMSEAHKRRGTRPPKARRSWTADEDDLVHTASTITKENRT